MKATPPRVGSYAAIFVNRENYVRQLIAKITLFFISTNIVTLLNNATLCPGAMAQTPSHPRPPVVVPPPPPPPPTTGGAPGPLIPATSATPSLRSFLRPSTAPEGEVPEPAPGAKSQPRRRRRLRIHIHRDSPAAGMVRTTGERGPKPASSINRLRPNCR
jgi:hypothetical protein